VTEASANGATDRQIMRQTGQKSRAMVDRYARRERKDRQATLADCRHRCCHCLGLAIVARVRLSLIIGDWSDRRKR
jgi:hypothetical protein